jgi:hypothetical protein
MAERHTVCPQSLLPRAILQEEPSWSLENSITLESSETLELRCERIEHACVEWRALGDIGRIVLHDLFYRS